MAGRYVEGDLEVIRGLESLRGDLTDLPESYDQVAHLWAVVASRLAPHQSNRLADSVVGVSQDGQAGVTAGNRVVRYAGPINFGWPRRHIRPSRFLERSADQVLPRAVDLLEHGIDKAIQRRGFK